MFRQSSTAIEYHKIRVPDGKPMPVIRFGDPNCNHSILFFPSMGAVVNPAWPNIQHWTEPTSPFNVWSYIASSLPLDETSPTPQCTLGRASRVATEILRLDYAQQDATAFVEDVLSHSRATNQRTVISYSVRTPFVISGVRQAHAEMNRWIMVSPPLHFRQNNPAHDADLIRAQSATQASLETLAATGVPILILLGEQDTHLRTPAVVHWLEDHMPSNVQWHVLPNADHMLFNGSRNPKLDFMMGLIDDFLATKP